MRILHIAYNSYPDGTGGAVRTGCLAEAQARLGAHVAVLSSPFQAPADGTRARGVEHFGNIPYYRCHNGCDTARFMAQKPWWERGAKLAWLIPFARRIGEVARLERVEVIHAHSLFFCGLAAAWAGRALGVPVIYEVRSLIEEGMEGAEPWVRAACRGLEALACRLASHVTVISEGLRGELVRRGVPEGKITVAGNGVDLAAHQPAAEGAGGRPGGTFGIGYIGTLSHYEGLDLLLEAVARLRPRHPEVQALLVGDGPVRASLEARAAGLGLRGAARFLGHVSQQEAASWYEAIDLFVLPRRPSRLTDLVTPLKPLEIMAHARPLLAGDCGGHRELIVDGVNGELFGEFEAGALADRIERMMAHPDKLLELGRRARRWVEEHRSWESQCRPVLELYERLAHRRRVVLVAPAPQSTVTGGVENGVEMILRSRLAQRHELRLWDRNRYRKPGRTWPARTAGQLVDFARFAAMLAAARPDVVHIKSSSGANFVESAVYAAVSRGMGRRTLLQLHSGDFEAWCARQPSAARWAIRHALRAPSGLLVLSEYWRDRLARLAGGGRIRVVPNGVEIPGEPHGRRANGCLRVLTIATLGAHKGHYDILAAAAALKHRPIQFLLAGPDRASGRGEGADVRRRAAELGLNGSVEFLGAVDRTKKRELLAEADVFLLPSWAEGMPNAVLEAMAAGLPVVATSVGSLPEMLPLGPLASPGDAVELARALADLLDDPARREVLGRANRARAESRYSLARVEELLDAVYRES